jgi:hypothetical protein
MAEIDPYPISALQDRYGLSSRQAVYDRINALGIQPIARGKISSDQLDLLDKLDKHIKVGATIEDFVNPKSKIQNLTSKLDSPQHHASEEIARNFPTPVIVQLLPPADPLQNLRSLSEASEKGWALPTSKVLTLLGLKSVPRRDRYTNSAFFRWGFKFQQVGRHGREVEWKVSRVD